MILLDKPYVSDFLIKTIIKNKIPVVKTSESVGLIPFGEQVFITENEAIQKLQTGNDMLYTNSENSIGWIEKNLFYSNLAKNIKLFKNKFAFRKLLQKYYPDYFFRAVTFEELNNLNITSFPFPFIIKPVVGFFSMGVYKVNSLNDWPEVLKKLNEEVITSQKIYPDEVYNDTEFIIEQEIKGEEVAVDCYFNREGQPVVLNIMQHVFSTEDDVNDRLYFTSKKVIKEFLSPVNKFLGMLNQNAGLKSFPMHVELRMDEYGKVIPIEINSLRFGGWCSSPDLAWYAYGINVYEYFFKQSIPDWDSILKKTDEKAYCIIVLDNNSGIDSDNIEAFNYKKLVSGFKKVWELRKVDFHTFPFFGMLFLSSESENSEEINSILKSDLKEFIILKK